MNEEKLKQILSKIGQSDVPPNIALIAEQASQNFTAALNILQAQRPPLSKFFIGFRRVAVAAVILFTFAVGLSVGRRSKPPIYTAASSQAVASIELPGRDTTQNFWRDKALALLESKPYPGTQHFRQPRNLLDIHNQYVKEKCYE